MRGKSRVLFGVPEGYKQRCAATRIFGSEAEVGSTDKGRHCWEFREVAFRVRAECEETTVVWGKQMKRYMYSDEVVYFESEIKIL